MFELKIKMNFYKIGIKTNLEIITLSKSFESFNKKTTSQILKALL